MVILCTPYGILKGSIECLFQFNYSNIIYCSSGLIIKPPLPHGIFVYSIWNTVRFNRMSYSIQLLKHYILFIFILQSTTQEWVLCYVLTGANSTIWVFRVYVITKLYISKVRCANAYMQHICLYAQAVVLGHSIRLPWAKKISFSNGEKYCWATRTGNHKLHHRKIVVLHQ